MKKISPAEYGRMARRASPASALGPNCLWAFFTGGSICLVGEVLGALWRAAGLEEETAALAVSASLIFLSALFTALGWYQKLARRAGAGTLVPITGFANAVVSPAIEFKCEGLVTGVAAKMFVIAGPVIVYGILASEVYGLLLWLSSLL